MLAPPRPPAHDELEALIREARQRQRMRRLGNAAVAAAVATVVLVAFGIARGLPGRSAPAGSPLTPVVDAHAFAGYGTLAFVSRDRLWVLDGRTGSLVKAAGAGAGSPTFSPNGWWLAWSQGRRFGIAHSDGRASRVLPSHGNAPAWLPDGRLLVGGAIYRMASGVPVRVGPAPKGLQSWTPDGTGYAFVEVRAHDRRAGSFTDVERVEVSRSLNGPRRVWFEIRSRFTSESGFSGAAIGAVSILPQGGVLVSLDPLHSGSLAADGEPVYEIRSPGARPDELGVSLDSTPSLGTNGRFALGAGGDRIAWTAKRVVTCAGGRCTPLPSAPGQMSVEPAWSPDGRSLAYVTAADLGTEEGATNPTMRRWYATRRLWIGAEAVVGSQGAASPVWSSDSRSLLFVKQDGLWLLPRVGGHPVRVAGPLFWPGRWPNYFGEVDWSDQFAWDSR